MLFVNDENDEPQPLCVERLATGARDSGSPGSPEKIRRGTAADGSYMLSPAKFASGNNKVPMRDTTTFDIVSHHRAGRGLASASDDAPAEVISIVSPSLKRTLQSTSRRRDASLAFNNDNLGSWEQWRVLACSSELGEECDASVKALLRNMRWGTEIQVQVVRPVQLAQELIQQWSSLVIDAAELESVIAINPACEELPHGDHRAREQLGR